MVEQIEGLLDAQVRGADRTARGGVGGSFFRQTRGKPFPLRKLNCAVNSNGSRKRGWIVLIAGSKSTSVYNPKPGERAGPA